MIICDLSMQAMQLILAVPITYAGAPIYGETLWLYIPPFVDTIFYIATLCFSILLTLNRLTVFMLPSVNRLLFGRPQIYITVSALWVCILGFVAARYALGCWKTFESNGFYMYWRCIDDLSLAGVILKKIQGVTSTYGPVGMLIAYIFIFLYIRCAVPKLPVESRNSVHFFERTIDEHQERTRRNREHGFLIQSFLICGMLEVQNLAFSYLPELGLKGQGEYVVNFVTNWISILLNTISPIILFTFNEDVRRHLKRILRREHKTEMQQTVTYIATFSAPHRASF
ncbi:Protein T22C8.1 [Aphelenchoides avenae]|nr:Protein T22C8.1 [Aphelenchus avenae]